MRALVTLKAGTMGLATLLVGGLPPQSLGEPFQARSNTLRQAQRPATQRPAGNPRGTWLGQDGPDKVGPSGRAEPNDVQDIHIVLEGLPRPEITSLIVKGLGGDEWRSDGQGAWLALLEHRREPSMADVYIEPTRVETGRGFEILLKFADGTQAGFFIQGGKADPNRRATGAALQARWVGPGKLDRVGDGPAVGPDGIPDVRLALEKLSAKTGIASVRIEGPAGAVWQSGLNPEGSSNAELIRQADDPTMAEVLFQPSQDLKGASLKVTVTYDGGRTDKAAVIAGVVPARSAARVTAPPSLLANKISARWLGQDGKNLIGPGDVHVTLENLPSSRAVAAVALSNASRAGWSWWPRGKGPYTPDPFAMPLEVRRGTDGKSLHLFFPPDRDETGATLTARLIFDDGKATVARIPGGTCEVTLRSAPLGSRTVTAQPGADLHALVTQSGTIRLAKGTYALDRPLILAEPVRLIGEPGTVLRFSQAADSAPWTAAIKIHAGNTQLEGFAVRFAGPIRWRPDVDFDPAVIGTTDNHDEGKNDPKLGITLTRLDLESPPPANPEGREEAVALARLMRAGSGRIERCQLRGGMIRFTKGPWEIVDNEYRGTHPGTFSWAVFSTFNSHDLRLKGNTARLQGASGKTWRFLVQTVSGLDDLIEGNTVEGLGPRDDDTIHENAPELILTEAYRLHFEGKITTLSPDGRVLTIPALQGDHARTGDIVAVLSGPEAGQWSRVSQAIDPTTYLVDPPLPRNTQVVSIVTGFVNETYRGNTIDTRGGTVACNLVLVGNHFGLKVIDNRLLGGGGFKITSAPSEQPVHWGWSHAPCFDVEIRGNTLEDQQQPALLAVEREGPVKSSKGRVYMTATLKDNIVSWTTATPKGILGVEDRIGLRLNDVPRLDPSELVVTEQGNRGKGGPARLKVIGATVNGRAIGDETIALP